MSNLNDANNPYQSPAETSEPHDAIRGVRGPMPASVIIAATIVALVIASPVFAVVGSLVHGRTIGRVLRARQSQSVFLV